MSVELGIPQNRREQTRDFLFSLLSNCYLLLMKTQNYHWNIQGPFFQPYHQMLETFYNDLTKEVDALAERIQTLGFHVPASYKNFKAQATLEEEEGHPSASEMLKNLLNDHEHMSRDLREIIGKLKETEDEGTTDLLIGCLQSHEKAAWFLRSHLNA